MKEIILQLNTLDLVVLGIALASLFGNLFQFMIWWRDQKNLHRPMSSSLIGLFNDIKSKANHAFFVQNTLFQDKNPHQTIETLRWEYAAYTQTVWNYLQGFQETVVAVLVSMNPEDRDGREAFRASDYGLTEDEKALRREYAERFQKQAPAESPAQPPGAPDNTSDTVDTSSSNPAPARLSNDDGDV